MILLLLFTVVPAIEIAIFVAVGSRIGVFETVAVVLLVGVTGAALARSQGARVLVEVQQALSRGRMPTRELVEGAMIVAAGALLLTPGFFTDVLALVLLLPGTRHVAAALLLRWFANRATGAAAGGFSAAGGSGGSAWSVHVGPARPGAIDLRRIGPAPDAPRGAEAPPTLDASFTVEGDEGNTQKG